MPTLLRSRHARQFATLVTLALLVLLTGTAASVIVAGDTPRRVAGMSPSPAFELDAYRTRNAIRNSLDSLVAPLGPPVPIDESDLGRIIALTRSRTGDQIWINIGSTAQPDDTGDLALFRRFARANPLPALWGYREGLPSARLARHLPARRLQVIRKLHDANEKVADSLLMAGNAAQALVHARENLAVARHYLDEPLVMDVVNGRALMLDAAALLQRAAHQADEPSIVTAAKEFQSLVKGSFAAPPVFSRLYRYGRDARSRQLLSLASDRSVHASLRLASLQGVVEGACLNTREMLFGIGEDRRRLFEQVADAIGDIPRAKELIPLYRRDMLQFDNGTMDSLAAAGYSPRALSSRSAFEKLVPNRVRARAAYCRAEL